MKKNNGNRKNSVRNFVSVFVIGLSVLFSSVSILSCNASILDNPTNDIEKENGETVPQYVEIIFSTALPSFGRKAIPNADAYSNMVYRLTGIDEQSDNEQVLGLWGSLRQLQNASIKVHTGPWTFILTTYTNWDSEASVDNNQKYAVLQSTIEITLQQATTLQFTLKEIEDCQVNGSFNFILNYSSSENWSVSAKVLNADDFSETNYSLSCETYSNNTRITCESIPSGNYLLKIQFVYTIGDDSFESYTMPLIQIAAGLNTTGSTNLSADELNRFYNINYDLDNGVMPAGYVTEYNPYKSVLLDNPTRENYKFLGWYFNNDWADENKLPVNDNGNYVFNKNHDLSGNVSVYARWQRIGYVQDGFEWHLSDNGVLTISGEGEVPFAAYSFPEWVNATSVIVEEGVTGFHYYEYNNVGFGCATSYNARNIKTISLPSTLTSIPNQCFDCLSSLEEINIPESVVSIGAYAFYGCKLLKELRLPDGLTSIGAHAFGECSKLTSITIPASVTTIYMSAFSDWGAEQAITLDWNSTDTTARSVNADDFENVNTINIHYKDGKDSWPLWTRTHYEQDGFTWNLSVDGVLTIRGEGEVPFYARSFSEWKRASRIVVDEGITGFAYCDGYYDRTGFNSYTGYGANCQNVRTVSLPSTLTSIPDSCFENCTSLESINIPSNVASIATEAFYGCTSLQEITIPASVTTLNRSAFRGWSELQKIFLDWDSDDETERIINTNDSSYTDAPNAHYKDGIAPWYSWSLNENGVLTIRGTGEVPFSSYSFSEWKNATRVIVEEGITGFRYGYYDGVGFGGSECYGGREYSQNIKNITLPSTMISIPSHCFYECKALETINIPENVTSIGNYAFYGCTSLEAITIPENVLSVDEYAFQNCTSLSSLTMNENVTYVRNNSFNGCTSLTDIPYNYKNDENGFSWSLRNGVLTIRGNGIVPFFSNSFDEWQNATSVIVGEGVTGFYCYHDTYWTDRWDVGFSGYNTDSTKNIKNIILPNTLTTIPDCCFYGCTSLESITIPSNVNSIGNSAFSNCTSLQTITISSGVNTIGESAFYGCTALKNITIPSSVISIGNSAFNDCSSLLQINLTNGLTTISENAFKNCTSISSITIPASVTNLNRSAFSGWSDEQKIIFDWYSNDPTERNLDNVDLYTIGTNAKNIDGKVAWFSWLLNEDGLLTIRGTGNIPFNSNSFDEWKKATNVVIEEGITGFETAYNQFVGFGNNIGHSYYSHDYYYDPAYNSVNIRSISLPSSLTSIPDNCFYGCTSLEEINIPNNVTSIGNHVFQNCTSLESITIPNSITSIGEYAFYECSELTEFTIPSSVTTIGDCALAYCTGISSITVPATVTNRFNKNVFCGWRSNQTITLDWNSNDSTHAMPYVGTWWNNQDSDCQGYWGTHAKYRNGVYAWNGNTFNADGTTIIVSGEGQHYAYNNGGMDLEKVTSIVVQKGITSLVCGDIPENNTTVKTVSLPSTLTSLGDSVFEGFAGIEQIEIPSTVTSIARDAFRGCSSLKSITIPDGVSSIRECTFDGCTSLDEVNLPGSIESIYEYAFQDCTSLEAIELPAAITSIDRYAFYGSGIKEIELPAALTSLGSYTFKNSSIESINFNGTSVAIPEECFASCSSLQTVTGTTGITSIGKNAFRECSSLSTISLSGTLTSIAEYAFYKCTGFTALTIPSSVTEIGSSAFDYCTGSQTITLDWNASDSTERTIASDAFGYAGVVVKYEDGTNYGN